MTDDQTRRPRGRRDNGLQARSYLALSDVDPRVGEHLLDVLYLAGIAAYLRPSMDTDVVTRAASLPSHPSDRIFVDRARLVEARRLVTAEAAEAGRPTGHPMAGSPQSGTEQSGAGQSGAGQSGAGPSAADQSATGSAESARGDTADHQPTGERAGGDLGDPQRAGSTFGDPTAQDFDAAFASIIAGYDTPTAEPVNRWSVAEDVDDASPTDDDRTSDTTSEDSLDGAADTEEAAGPRDWQPGAQEEDDERYVPPPPPPLPHVSRGTGAALAIMAIGVLLFLFPGLLALSGDLALAVPIGAIVVGVVILVWRMYDGPPVDDGPDDGAVV